MNAPTEARALARTRENPKDMMIVGVYVVSGLHVEKTKEVARKCGHRRQLLMVFHTICGVILKCCDLYSRFGNSDAMRCCSNSPSRAEIRIRPFERMGSGCSGDPGRNKRMRRATDMVNTPSTITFSLATNTSTRNAIFRGNSLKNIHCQPESPRFPSSLMMPDARRGLIAFPPNIPKKKMATLLARSFCVYHVDSV